MHRIDDPTAVAIMPVPRAQGVPGFFTRGQPGVQNPTIVRYEWLNTVQGEIEHVITSAGIALDKLDNTQLFQAIMWLMAQAVDDPPDDGYSYTRVANRWVSGGVIRNDVTFGANLTVGATLAVGLGGSPFQMYRSSGYQTVMHSSEWYDQYEEATGNRYWIGNIGAGPQHLMTLTAGNLWVTGSGTFAGVTSNGHVHAGTLGVAGIGTANIFTANLLTSNGDINAAGAVSAGQLTSHGNINASNSIDAAQNIGCNYLASRGNIYAAGNIDATGRMTSADIMCNTGTFYIGGSPVHYFARADAWRWVENNFVLMTLGFAGQLSIPGTFFGASMSLSGDANIAGRLNSESVYSSGLIHGDPVLSQANVTAVGSVIAQVNGYKPGGGPWLASFASARMHKDVRPYDRGLDVLLRLVPKEYSYISESGFDSTRRHIGLEAEDVADLVPEMLVEGATDNAYAAENAIATTAYMSTPLTYMMVNAIKELTARVETLEQGGR